MRMKKLILTLIIALTGLFLVACTPKEKEKFAFSSNKEVYGFEAMSAGFILNNFSATENTPVLHSNEGTLTALKGKVIEVSEEEIAIINEYLGVMEQMLGDENKPLTVDVLESDREGFEHKMVITTKDLKFNEIEYILYYNEIFEEEIIEENEDTENFEEKFDDEKASLLEGILIVGLDEFEVVGKKEVDSDELKISFEARLDSKNWVKIEQEIENDELEFKYVVCANGVKTVTKISIEEEDNQIQMKLTFGEGHNKSKYFFKLETEDNEKIIKVKVVNEELSAVIKVYVTTDPETNEVTYEYVFVETGHKFTHKNKHAYKNGGHGKDNEKGQHGKDDQKGPHQKDGEKGPKGNKENCQRCNVGI